MNEKEVERGYGSVKMEILRKVNREGRVGDLDSWKRAFPEVEFLDYAFLDKESEKQYIDGEDEVNWVLVNWENRDIAEKIFYVALQKSGGQIEVRYDIVLGNELKVTRIVDEPDDLWYLWMNGCFSEAELGESGKRELLELIYDEQGAKMEYIDDLDLEEVQIVNILTKVAPW